VVKPQRQCVDLDRLIALRHKSRAGHDSRCLVAFAAKLRRHHRTVLQGPVAIGSDQKPSRSSRTVVRSPSQACRRPRRSVEESHQLRILSGQCSLRDTLECLRYFSFNVVEQVSIPTLLVTSRPQRTGIPLLHGGSVFWGSRNVTSGAGTSKRSGAALARM
jgi:hypothetical protein